MAELDPLTNLPEGDGNGEKERISKAITDFRKAPSKVYEGGVSTLDPTDITAPINIAETLEDKAEDKFVQIVKPEEITRATDFEKLQTIIDSRIKDEKQKYLTQLDADQNMFESTAAGVGKFLTKTVAGTGLGLLGTFWGAGKALFTWDINALVEDNFFTESEESVKKWADEVMPIYSDNPDYHNLGFLDKLMTEPGKLFGDEVGDALSFTASAIGQEILLSMATAATLGAAEPAQAAASLRLAKQGANIWRTLVKGKQAIKAGDLAGDVAKVYKNLDAAKKTASLSNKMKNFGATASGLAVATHYEAALEARGTKDAMMAKFQTDFFEQNGRQPTSQELADAEEIARDAMWTTYGMNAAILSASNMIQFSSIFNKGYTGIKNLQGVKDDIFREGLEYATKHSAKNKLQKFLTYSYLIGKNPVTEAMEEFSQGAAHEGALEYFGRQYSPDANKNALDFFSAYGKAASEYFTSKEGGNSMGIGAIVGLLGLPVGRSRGGWSGGIAGEISQYKKKIKQAEQMVEMLNSTDFKSTMKENFKNQVISASLEQDMLDAATKNDVFEFKNLEHDKMFTYMYNRVKLGLKDDVIDDIQKLKNISLEQFNEEFAGEATEPFTQEQKDATIQKAINFVESIEENTKAVEQILEYNARKQRNKKNIAEITYSGEQVKDYLIHAASTLKNLDVRETELTDRLSEISNFSAEEINEIAKQSKHYTKLNKLSQFAKKEKKGQKLTEEQVSERNQILKDLNIQRKEFKELAQETDAVSIDQIRNLMGEFQSLDLGVDQTDFMKLAEQKVGEYAVANPTKATVNRGEMMNIIEDIGKLKNRRDSFAKFYEYLATEEGAKNMSKLIDAAGAALGQEIEGRSEEEAVKAAQGAKTTNDLNVAKQKADTGLGNAAGKVNDTISKKAKDDKGVNKFNPAVPYGSLTKRYEGSPELFDVEGQRFLEFYNGNPNTTDISERLLEDPKRFANWVQAQYTGQDVNPENIKAIEEFYSTISEEIDEEFAANRPADNPTDEETVEAENITTYQPRMGRKEYLEPQRLTGQEYASEPILDKGEIVGYTFKRSPEGTLEKDGRFQDIDWDYIREGNLDKNTEIKYKVELNRIKNDPWHQQNLTGESQKANEKFANNFLITAYVVDSQGNERTIGFLPATPTDSKVDEYDGDAELINKAEEVHQFRKSVYRMMQDKGLVDSYNAISTEQESFEIPYVSKVQRIGSGRMDMIPSKPAGKISAVTDEVILAVAKEFNGNIALQINNNKDNIQPRQVKGLTKGAVYFLVKSPNGDYIPVPANTRKVTEAEADTIIDSLTTAYASFDERVDALDAEGKSKKQIISQVNSEFVKDYKKPINEVVFLDIMPNLLTTTDKVWQIKNKDNSFTEMTTDEVRDLILSKRAQVDYSQTNTSNYNSKIDGDKLTTKLNSQKPFHSPTVTVSGFERPGSKKVTPAPIKEEIKETTSSEKKVEEKKPSGLAGLGMKQDFDSTDTPGDTSTKVTPKELAPKPKGIKKGKFGKPNKGKTKMPDANITGKWDKKKSLAWMKKNIPNVPVSVLDDMNNIFEAGGKQAWGVFQDAAIFIAENAGTGTAYHEAFHAVFNLYLNENQRVKLLTEAQAETGLQDDIALEEFLADKFAEYVQSGVMDESLKPQTKNFFQRVWSFIKSLVGKDSYSIGELFERINSGKYSNKRVKNSFKGTRYSLNDIFTAKEKAERIDMLNSLVLDEIEELMEEHDFADVAEAINRSRYEIEYADGTTTKFKGIHALYASIYENFVQPYWKTYDTIGQNGYNWDAIKATTHYKENPEMYEDFEGESEDLLELRWSQFDLLKDEFIDSKTGEVKLGSLIRLATKNLSKYNIKIKFGEVAKESDKQETEQADASMDEGYNYEAWQTSRAQTSGKDTATFYIKHELSKFYDVYLEDNGDIETSTDSIGFPKRMDFNKVFNNLKHNLTNISTSEEMIDLLREKAQVKPYYTSIADRMEEDDKFRAAFFHALATTTNNATMVLKKVSDEGRVSYNIIESNRNAPERIIRNEWNASYLYNIESKGLTPKKATEVFNSMEKLVGKIKLANADELSYNRAKQLSEQLSGVGIELSQRILRDTYKSNPAMFISYFEGASGLFNTTATKIKEGKNPFAQGKDAESKGLMPFIEMGVQSRMDLYESAYMNVEGKQQFSNVVPNHFSRLISDLTNSKKYKDIIKEYKQDDFYKDHLWLNELSKSKETRDLFSFTVLDGIKDDSGEAGTKYTKLSPKERMVLDMVLFHNETAEGKGNERVGKYTMPILADAPQLPIVQFKKYSTDEVLEHLVKVWEQETRRIEKVKKEQKQLADNELIKNYHTGQGEKYHYIKGGQNIKSKEQAKEYIKENILDKEIEKTKKALDGFGLLFAQGRHGLSGSIKNIDEFVENYVANTFLANTNMLQLFSGDSAFYKSQVDLAKRNKQISNPGNLLDLTITGPTYRSLYLKDEELTSKFIDIYKKVLKNVEGGAALADSYTGINQTDAQAYISIDRYKNVLSGAGLWTDAHEDVYTKVKTGTKLDAKEMGIVMQPIKPFVYGKRYDAKTGTMIPTQNKNSEFLVIPQMIDVATSEKDKNRIKTILELFEGNNKVDSLQFESAVKVGSRGLVRFDEISADNMDAIKENAETLNNADYRIQLNVPEHHLDTTVLFGTQIRKLAISNIKPDTMYSLPEYSEEPISGRELIGLYQEAIVGNIEEDYNSVANLFTDSEGKTATEKIAELIQEEVEDRGLSEKYIKAVQVKDGKFSLPLFFPLLSKKIESLLSSIFKNRITKQKIKGGSFVQVSDFTFSEQLKVTSKTTPTGEVIEYMEALMPWWSKKYFPVNENGEVDINQIPDELKELVGFRIPTEAKYSFPIIKVVGFTPQQQGGIIVLPADMTKRVGADFDIDKMFVMMPEFEEVDGKVQKVKPSMDSKASRNNMALDIIKSIMHNSAHQKEVMSYNTFDTLKGFVKKYDLDTADELNMSLPSTQFELFKRNMAGKDLIGIFANHNSNHTVLQHTGIEFALDPQNPDSGKWFHWDGRYILDETGKEGVTYNRLNRIENLVDGKLITKSLAEFLAAAVDNAKDPVLSLLNINTFTADTVAMLVRSGLDLNSVLAIINQPVIRELSAQVENGTDPKKAIREMLAKFKSKTEKAVKGENVNLNIAALKRRLELASLKRKSKLTANEAKRMDALEKSFKEGKVSKTALSHSTAAAFNHFYNLAGSLGNLTAASRADSKGSVGISANTVFQRKIDEALNDENFKEGTVDALFNGQSYPMLREFTNKGVTEATNKLSEYFPWENTFFSQIKDALGRTKQFDLSEKELELINSNVVTYLGSKFDFFNLDKDAANKILTELPGKFHLMKQNDPEFRDNPFIEALYYNDSKKELMPRIMTNNTARLEEVQKQLIEEGFMELVANPKYSEMAQDLVKYSFMASGFNFSPVSFNNLFDTEFFINLKNEQEVTLADFLEGNKDILLDDEVTNFVEMFLQNNFNKFNLVKGYAMSTITKNAKEWYTTNGKGFPDGTLTSFIVENDSNISKRDYVKVTSEGRTLLYKRNEPGNNYSMFELLSPTGVENFFIQYNPNIKHSIIEDNLIKIVPKVGNVRQPDKTFNFTTAAKLRNDQEGYKQIIHNLSDFTKLDISELSTIEQTPISQIEEAPKEKEEIDQVTQEKTEPVATLGGLGGLIDRKASLEANTEEEDWSDNNESEIPFCNG